MFYREWIKALSMIGLGSLLLAACQSQPVGETPTVSPTRTAAVTSAPTVLAPTDTPTPVVPEERTLVVCMGREPVSLYRYSAASPEKNSVLQAIYDGPIDFRSYEPQPVILQKIPNLADGDAALQPVDVTAGDLIVNAEGNLANLLEGEVVLPAGCTSPECAVAYEGQEDFMMDQLVVEFKLLPGLTWSDGAPLTASDSVYAYNLEAHPDTPADKFKVERTDRYAVLAETSVVWAGLPGYFDPTYRQNFWSPLPEHLWGIFSPADLSTVELSSQTPLGWGPYAIEEWEAGRWIRLRKNPNYFRAAEGLPVFDNLLFRFVGQDSNPNIAQILSRECDIVDQTARLDDQVELLLQLEESGQIQFNLRPGTDWEHADFGIKPLSYENGFTGGVDRPDFFGDPRTRQAVALCMDRDRVTAEVLYGQSVRMDNFLPPDHPLASPNITTYPYDVEAASALLAEVGWVDDDDDPGTPRVAQGVPNVPNGTGFSFSYLTSRAVLRSMAAEILTSSLAACGIQAALEQMDAGELYATGPVAPVFGRQFEMSQFAWQLDVVPRCDLYSSRAIPGENVDVFPFSWGGWNATGYSDPAYDAACQRARFALPGLPDYQERHWQVQELFAENLPVVPLYLHLKMAAGRPDLCGFDLDATAGEMWNLEMFDYGEDCQG